MTARQIVEFFHLVFVRALFANVSDKSLLAVKGGINLRFFFQSVRVSEDLDLDVVTMSKAALENRVDRLLASATVTSPLKARGIVIQDISKPKQTDTVQRWKLEVASPATSVHDRTKIEFSRRDLIDAAAHERVDAQIANAYEIPAFLANHYRCDAAVRQKIHALAERAEPQPRDVFDLNVLLARKDAPKKLDDDAKQWLDAAIANAADLTYEQYVSLVVAYLDPEQAEIYSSQEAWESMQLDVVAKLEVLK
ncbi:MAG TPA: nucleotidyl transferase AbiEii/AbiGii toxin family protein [Kofleriaceae bacterium]|nr:nucleotidyl transferase AbiEii/AbiGii toxin family protein [Kofleriaceae bacterium]